MRRTSARRHLLRYITAETEGGVAAPVEETTLDTATGEEAEAEETDTDEEEDAQEAFDQDRALRKIRKANAEARAQRERAKAAEAKAATVGDLERENAELKRTVIQMQTAAQYGLPAKLAERLRGETVEEMSQDAQELLELLTPAAPPSAHPKAGAPAPRERPFDEAEETDIDAIGRRMVRR